MAAIRPVRTPPPWSSARTPGQVSFGEAVVHRRIEQRTAHRDEIRLRPVPFIKFAYDDGTALFEPPAHLRIPISQAQIDEQHRLLGADCFPETCCRRIVK